MNNSACFESASSDEHIPQVIDDCIKLSGYDVNQAKACIRAAIRKANAAACNFCRMEVVVELESALKHLET